jgi:TolB-like protein/Tfp pilus assembly protein PilF
MSNTATNPLPVSTGGAVFVSYASQDAAAAKLLCEALAAAGLEVWFDQNELGGGDVWDRKIRAQIGACALFVPVVSAATQARREGYFRLEWKLADERTHLMAEGTPFILPVVIDDTKDREALVPKSFLDVQWTRLPGGEAGAAFGARAKKLLGREAEIVGPVADRAPGHRPGLQPKVGRRVPAAAWGAAVVLLVLALGGLWWQQVKPAPTSVPSADAAARPPTAGMVPAGKVAEKSVVVLPFENLGAGADNGSFSDGISDELLNVLGKVPGLRVMGRNSAFAFKGRSVAEAEIARQLGVSYVVNGSVQPAGTQVRINVRLTNAVDGFLMWSEKFTEELKDILAVQDRIAGLIAQNLQLKLGGAPRAAKVVNPEAYRLLLEGRHFWNLRNEDGFARAEVAFTKALQIDSVFAEAHAGIAGVCAIRAAYRQLDSFGESAEDIERGRAEAKRAIELDASLSEAHAALGFLLMMTKDFEQAGPAFQQALALNPNSALANCWYAILLAIQGKLDVSTAAYRKAAELDPLWFINMHLYGGNLGFTGRDEEALKILERAAALRTEMWVPNRADQATLLLRLGRRAEAVQAARQVLHNLDERPRWTGDAAAVWVLRQAGLDTEATAAANQLFGRLAPDSYLRGFVLCALGRSEEALPYLERMPVFSIRMFAWDPMFDALRGDPRLAGVLAKLGRTESYRVARETLARMQKEQAAKK